MDAAWRACVMVETRASKQIDRIEEAGRSKIRHVMADEHKTDDVESFLADQKALEDRKQGLIDYLLKQKADAIKSFDEKLAKAGLSGRRQAEAAPPQAGRPGEDENEGLTVEHSKSKSSCPHQAILSGRSVYALAYRPRGKFRNWSLRLGTPRLHKTALSKRTL